MYNLRYQLDSYHLSMSRSSTPVLALHTWLDATINNSNIKMHIWFLHKTKNIKKPSVANMCIF